MSLKISVYLKPRYSLEKSESNKLFLKRVVRIFPNGKVGVFYRGKAFTLYKDNFIDHKRPEGFAKEECPVTCNTRRVGFKENMHYLSRERVERII